MADPRRAIEGFLRAQHRSIASIAITVMMANALVVASRAMEPANEPGSFVGAPGTPGSETPFSPEPGVTIDPVTGLPTDPADPTQFPTIDPVTGLPTQTPGQPVKTPGRALGAVRGVTDDTIKIVYYWKGERTQTSPFINGTAAEGANLDEELAFNAYIDYINKHADGSATFFGQKINLHGRKLVGVVEAPKDAGSGDFAYSQIATKIVTQHKPFAAVASHGSISSYICPYLAENGIFNLQTYDLGGKGGTLVDRTNGFCTPAGLTWERQIDLTIGYLKKHQKEQYKLGQPRVYGLIYTTYPGLKDVAGQMIAKLEKAGIEIRHHAALGDSLANAQTQAPTILYKMREKGVNTLIMPEAGSPLVVTHAAQAQEYYPDYFVWPCSGSDVSGMVRLFQPVQWEGAEGITCYDREFNPDAVNSNISRRAEWWKAFQEVRPGKEPPAPSPLVYSGLYQLVAGISNAGRNLTPETFKQGLNKVPVFRYDSIDGATSDPTNMLITMRDPDRSFIGDVGYLRWSATASEGGAQGAYRYPENRRYRNRADFN